MNKPVVAECSRLHHAYGDQPALQGVDLALAGGRVTALLGPNGAGKTTLIHLMLGIIPVGSGRIRLFDSLQPGSTRAKQRIGVMLQANGVQDNLTVRELMALFASFYPEPAARAELLAELDLSGLVDRRFDRLSGGQQQRVLFALAVIGRPDWLVLDEPTTGLDPGARRIIWQAIQRRREAGASILLCTHFMDEAQKLADHVVVLDRGRILAEGSPDAIRRRVPSDRIRLRTQLDPERIGAMPGVRQVSVGEDRTDILSRRGVETVRALLDADPDVADLEVAGADLETAFLALTGSAGAEGPDNDREAA